MNTRCASTYFAKKPIRGCRWGGSFPWAFVSVLYAENASLSWPDKSLVLASAQRNLGTAAVAKYMGLVPIGDGVRQDVPAATEVDANSSDDDFASWATYRKATKSMGKKEGAERKKGKADKDKGDSETMNGENSKTGRRHWRYLRNSEYHLLPECPRRGATSKSSAPISPPPQASTRHRYSSISWEPPVEVQGGGPPSQEFFLPLWKGGNFSAAGAESAVVLGVGATANLVCFKRLDSHTSSMKTFGIPRAQPYPGRSRSKFGNGRLGEV